MERMTKSRFHTVDEYIGTFPPEVQAKLEAMRAAVKAAAPDATEKIGYQMPAYTLHGTLVYFGAWKTHIGFYPATAIVTEFADQLQGYGQSKGAIRFPLDQPLPVDLVTQIVRRRVAENMENHERKRAEKAKRRRKAGDGGG